MTGSASEVLQDHVRAVTSGDMQVIVADYADHAQVLTAQGARKGKPGRRAVLHAGHVASARGPADSRSGGHRRELPPRVVERRFIGGRIDDGIDTFVIEEGLITLQTPTFTVQPRSQ
jgi:hypothetical protein